MLEAWPCWGAANTRLKQDNGECSLCFSRFFGCGLPFPAKLDGCRVLDLGSGSGRDCFAFSKLVGESGHVTGLDMTEELVIREACPHSVFESWISVLSSHLTCSSSGCSVSPVCRVPSEDVWLQGSQRVFRPGIHGEAQWGWNTKRHNWCCAVGLENRHYSTLLACISF